MVAMENSTTTRRTMSSSTTSDRPVESLTPSRHDDRPVVANSTRTSAPLSSSSSSSSFSSSSVTLASKQLDLDIMETYLLSLLHVEGMFRYFPKPAKESLSKWVPKVVIPLISIWLSNGQTPGCYILQLQRQKKQEREQQQTTVFHRYHKQQQHHQQQQQQQPSTLSHSQRLILYAALSIALPELYQQLKNMWWQRHRRRHSLAATTSMSRPIRDGSMQEQQNTNPLPHHQQQKELAQQRRELIIKRFFFIIDRMIPFFRLILLCKCWNTRGRISPNLATYMSGLQLYEQQQQQQHTSHHYPPSNNMNNDNITATSPFFTIFAHRRWLYQELSRSVPMIVTPCQTSIRESIELLQVWHRKWIEPLQRYLKLWKKPSNNNDENSIEINKSCPICNQEPILVPYQIQPCNHVYCYTCLWQYIITTTQEKEEEEGDDDDDDDDHHHSTTTTNNDTTDVNNSIPCRICYTTIQSCQPLCYKISTRPSPPSDKNKIPRTTRII